jgi:hypothetical protein
VLGVLALTAAATWMVVQQARRMYQTRTAMAWPESTAIHQFVSILVALRRAARAQWLELEERRELIGSLECAATCIERYLPGRLRHADDATDRWLRGRTQAIAASLRDLKRGLCLPRASARDEVAKRVAAALLVSARGDWDLMEASAEPVLVEEKRPRSLKALALRGVLGVVLLAVVVWDQGKSPAALLGFADHLLHELNGLVGPLIVPTLGYALLKLVNPAVLENLSSIRDFGKRKDP